MNAPAQDGGRPPAQGSGRPPAEVVIGLDVGTTAAKVSAFGVGVDADWRTTQVREYPLLHPHPGWETQDALVILTAVDEALRECVRACAGADVIALSLSTAMHGLIGLDHDLRPATQLLTWADSRAADQARQLVESGQASALHRTSGTPVHSMSPLTKLLWFAAHEPELCARIRVWVGLKDLVVHHLTGVLVTELSCASGTGLLDLSTRDWNPAALDLAGVAPEQLPPVMATTQDLQLSAAAAARAGLPAGTRVVLGAGDGPLGNLGTGALEPGVVGLSIGTSGALRMMVHEPVVQQGLFCYALTERDWAVGGAVSNGGAVVRWAGDIFGQDLKAAVDGQRQAQPHTHSDTHPDAELLALAAQIPPGSDGLVMLPYLMAERAPLWDPQIPGAFLGVRGGHTRGHFVRAAVEGVAFQLSTILDQLESVHPVTEIRATGGVFRSELWQEILAAVLGKPLTLTLGTEGTALGAAALALVALERAGSLPEALRLLGVGEEDEHTVTATPEQIERYSELRASVPALLRQLAPVGALFGQPRPTKS